MKKAICTALLVSTGALGAQEPITINSLDLFYAPGQYYRAYAAADKVDTSVSGRIGPAGGPQTWNFSTGPTDRVFRFDYLEPAAAENAAALFPEAKLVERKRIEGGTAPEAFMFLDQRRGVGRMNFGFYDPKIVGPLGLDDPAGVFDPPLLDFPESMTLGSSWSVGTAFLNSMLEVPMRVLYTATARVDAWGLVVLPGNLGFMDCIRVNELAEWTYQIKFPDGGGFEDPDDPFDGGLGGGGGDYTTVATYYVRNLYWFAKDRGIVVQITSKESGTPPPDEFATAAQFVRMFETNHPRGSNLPEPVDNLQLIRGDRQILLNWSKPLNTTSFRVERTNRPGDPGSWTELATTSSNFVVDDIRPGEHWFYRIVSLP